LGRNIKSIIYNRDCHADNFFPRSYDLSNQIEFENWVEDFKFSKAESLIK